MQDIELARHRLKQERLSLVMVEGGQALATSSEWRVRPFSEALLSSGSGLRSAAVADRIVGPAATMLRVYARIASVYAFVASKGALAMLGEQGVDAARGRVVSCILNPDGTDLWPLEELAQRMNSPSQLLSAPELVSAKDNQ